MVCGERQYCCDETCVYTYETDKLSVRVECDSDTSGQLAYHRQVEIILPLVISAFLWNLSARVVCLSKDSINGERLKKDIVIGGLLASDR